MERIPEDNFSDSTERNNDAILSLLLKDLQQSVEDVARHFLGSMPDAYFQDTGSETRLQHIKALLATEVDDESQILSLHNRDNSEFTFICGQSYPGKLGQLVRQLPKDKPLLSAQVYTALDSSRMLDVFRFGELVGYSADDPQDVEQLALLCAKVAELNQDIDLAAFQSHLESCNRDYLHTTPPEQALRQFRIAQAVRQSGNLWLDLSPHRNPDYCQLTFAILDADNRSMFERITYFLGKQAIDIQRAYLDSFGGSAPLCIFSFLVQYDGRPFTADSTLWRNMQADLKRLAYLDENVFTLAASLGDCPLLDAEILHALGRLSHQLLVKQDAFTFTRECIYASMVAHQSLALAIAGQFRRMFTPNGETNLVGVKLRIGREVENPTEQTVLQTLMNASNSTLRCNLYLEDRFALALRIDPCFLSAKGRETPPFGVFFICGRGFDGFHVRFRDVARGGVRIVRPSGEGQYALESERHYDECYGLAYAQQLKNKDIPEGGSKGVILAQPNADFEQAGWAYADALLDLIVPAPDLFTLHRDYLRREEMLYLGPDENISNTLITWIINRARLRGHPRPDAFMSSKPGAGINHKQYGVTSEGVTVFLETALKEVDIDPRRQPFTVKITGGPDGDVAGNEILILDREFGDNVRILGIADGSGALEDPEGLNIGELKRLVRESLPVSAFDRDKLSDSGVLVTIHERDGVRLRNTLHNRVIADAFIPAGGRPRTINDDNWRAYLGDDGRPSSQVIVEGANLFITPGARTELGKAGVLIIKDSSANKCGVICSSYEIISSMLLQEQDFLAIKESYIAQVLDKLRELAATEAKSLLSERKLRPDADLPSLSIQLSQVINRAADVLANAMIRLRATHPQLTRKLFEEHVPEILLQTCGEQVYTDLPPVYLNRIIASRLASRIVYREGMTWFEHNNDAEIIALADRYLREEARVEEMITHLNQSELAGREEIIDLLQKGGVAAAMRE